MLRVAKVDLDFLDGFDNPAQPGKGKGGQSMRGGELAILALIGWACYRDFSSCEPGREAPVSTAPVQPGGIARQSPEPTLGDNIGPGTVSVEFCTS